MTETLQQEEMQKLMALHDAFAKAHPSQETLDEIPTSSLPVEYRKNIVLKMDRDNFYVAFSEDPKNLTPDENGYVQKAQLTKFSVYNGPRRTGVVIKEWIDKIRSIEE